MPWRLTITGIESLNLSAMSWASLKDLGITRWTRRALAAAVAGAGSTGRSARVRDSVGESSAKMSSISSRRRRVERRRTLGRSR